LEEELANFRLKINASRKSTPLKDQMNNYETEIIKKTLIDSGWNQSEAARRLDTSEKNIRYKMEKLNIRKPEIE
jgi:DNA-binding NtrC family response regulator